MGAPDADPLRQAEARAYARAERRIGLAESAVGLAGLIAIVASARRLGGTGSLAALAIVPAAISLPFGLASHRVSRAHGLSRQTRSGWLVDRAKGAAIGLALGGVAAAAVIAAQRLDDRLWPVLVGLGALGMSALLAVLFPVLLLPVFLKSEPLPPGPLADALRKMVERSGVAVRELRVLQLGEKTSAGNAMVAGLGPTRRIYVGDTLSSDASEPERVAETCVVLAHELGHHASGDPWRLLAFSALPIAAGAAGAALAVDRLAPHGAGRLDALPALVLGFAVASAAISPLGAWYSRKRERVADAYAVRVSGRGDVFASALERLAAQNLGELWPPRLHHLLTASHPRLGERIASARGGGG